VVLERGLEMAYRHGEERDQLVLFPGCLDEYVGPDHPVRAYDAFVEALDLSALGIEENENKVGPPEYAPGSMLKLLLYGYSVGIKSSRKLERAVHENLAFIWLMRNMKPDHKTIAEFRRKNREGLREALKSCARVCLKLGLIEGNILFVDSTKVRANGGRGQNHDQSWYRRQRQELDGRINRLLQEVESVDASEAELGSLVKMQEELVRTGRLKEGIERALSELEVRGVRSKNGQRRRVNRVDPESGIMKGPQGSGAYYAVQTVVDDGHGLIVGTDAVAEANDSHQLSGQVLAAEDNLKRGCRAACGDSGYANLEEFEKLESAERKVIVPAKSQVSRRPVKPFSKSEFTYDPESDGYYCPQGHRLTFRRFQDRAGKKLEYRIQEGRTCQACPEFGRCTASPLGRTIVRHRSEELKERMEKRFKEPEAQEIYKRRKARAEHPFGYIKKVLGFGQFLLRGRLGAQAEASILAVCFNLRRMITILGGTQGLIGRLAAL